MERIITGLKGKERNLDPFSSYYSDMMMMIMNKRKKIIDK